MKIAQFANRMGSLGGMLAALLCVTQLGCITGATRAIPATRLPDIYNLQMPADLVVLSACNTGVAQDMTGDALAGLVRGFLDRAMHRIGNQAG